MTKDKNLFLYFAIVLITVSNEILKATGKDVVRSSLSKEDRDYRQKYATEMLSYMNKAVNPCDDFYEYACGNWKTVIAQTGRRRDKFLQAESKLNDMIDEILKRSDVKNVAPEYDKEFKLLKKFYKNCMAANLNPKKPPSVHLAVLKEIGGFPAVDTGWKIENFDWLKMSAHMSNYGIESFVHEEITDSNPFLPYFTIAKFGFDVELHTDTIENSASKPYKLNENRMRYILASYGITSTQRDTIIREIFEFLKKILRVSDQFDDVEKCKKLSRRMTPSSLKAIKDKWGTYYNIAWMGKNFEDGAEDFDDCCSPCYHLYEQIDKICKENKRAAANYLSLKFLFHISTAGKDNKSFCISNVRSSMKFLIDHLYMKINFSRELRAEIGDFIRQLRQAFRSSLQNADWLDENTRTAALLKEAHIRERIGRHEDSTHSDLLIKEMKQLQFDEGSFETNYLNLLKFQQHIERFNNLNLDKLGSSPQSVQVLIGTLNNFFYNSDDNSIVVLAGMLMDPFYKRSWPNSLKFGTLGVLVAHEITHGFDSDGKKYDENGHEHNWWSKSSAKKFNDRAKCYVKHFNEYFIPEIKRNINGELTKDENIADAGGLVAALTAYRTYLKTISPRSALFEEEKMPGIKLSPEQLFFLSFAQTWCTTYEEQDYWRALSDEHTIEKYRVLGALTNNYDFANAYNCPLGSKMNPKREKCKLW